MRPDIQRHFTALGLSPGASANDIRVAYRKLIQEWHPDRFATGSLMQTTAEDHTKELNEAYEWLYKKRHYRRFLAGAAKPRPVARPVEPEEAPPPAAPEPRPRPVRKSALSAFAGRWSRWRKRAGILGLAAAAALALVAAWPRLAALGRRRPPESPAAAPAVRPAPVAPASPDPGATAARDRTALSPAAERRPPGPVAPVGPTPAAPPLAGTMPTIVPPSPESPLIGTAPASGVEADLAALPPPSLLPSLRPREVVLHSVESAVESAAAVDRDRRLDASEAELETFEMGDSAERVRRVQGRPDEAVPGAFRYGSSLVYFENGRVSAWIDGVPHLRIPLLWATDPGDDGDAFALGSTRDEVFRIQGAPDAIRAGAYLYGADVVAFAGDRVAGWIRNDGRLRARYLPALPFFDPVFAR